MCITLVPLWVSLGRVVIAVREGIFPPTSDPQKELGGARAIKTLGGDEEEEEEEEEEAEEEEEDEGGEE